jgi:acetate kinase
MYWEMDVAFLQFSTKTSGYLYGITPLEGLMMVSRSGDIDPGLLFT